MKYGDLFTLNPIETIIQLEKADRKGEAKRLVETFVITPSLGETIETVALPQLDFESGIDWTKTPTNVNRRLLMART